MSSGHGTCYIAHPFHWSVSFIWTSYMTTVYWITFNGNFIIFKTILVAIVCCSHCKTVSGTIYMRWAVQGEWVSASRMREHGYIFSFLKTPPRLDYTGNKCRVPFDLYTSSWIDFLNSNYYMGILLFSLYIKHHNKFLYLHLHWHWS